MKIHVGCRSNMIVKISKQPEIYKYQKTGKLKYLIGMLFLSYSAVAQVRDSLPTGHLLDAAEEYWPVPQDSLNKPGFDEQVKHMSVNHGKGFVSLGFEMREGYEHFDNYLWGIGPQDANGFFLHRVLSHADIRWNRHLRSFVEFEGSTISGRIGGPRPIQDVNKLSANQSFLELSFLTSAKTTISVRAGKQSLSYGTGSLLDVRDANVRRSFFGYKAIIAGRRNRIDAFYMQPVPPREGFFDDRIAKEQKVAGLWFTHFGSPRHSFTSRFDFYYIFIQRALSRFNQGLGRENRNTVGGIAQISEGNWTGFQEADLQWGNFNSGRITAWKLTNALSYQFKEFILHPVIGYQAAISSGDKTASDQDLQTFNPIYPKGFYYGIIDNAGSANLIVLHPKCDLQILSPLKITAGYYRFWRQQTGDGLYGTSGSYLFPAESRERFVGSMFDVICSYLVFKKHMLQVLTSYYKRGNFLEGQADTRGNIIYYGFRANFRI